MLTLILAAAAAISHANGCCLHTKQFRRSKQWDTCQPIFHLIKNTWLFFSLLVVAAKYVLSVDSHIHTRWCVVLSSASVWCTINGRKSRRTHSHGNDDINVYMIRLISLSLRIVWFLKINPIIFSSLGNETTLCAIVKAALATPTSNWSRIRWKCEAIPLVSGDGVNDDDNN